MIPSVAISTSLIPFLAMYITKYIKYNYLKLQHVLHSGCLAVTHARVEEAGRHRHTQGFTRHSSVCAGRIAGDHPERAKE